MPEAIFEVYRDGHFESGQPPLLGNTGRSGFVLGTVNIGSGNASGSVSDANLGYGEPFAVVLGTPIEGQPTVSISGTTVTWTDAYSGFWTGTLFYGVR